MTKLNKNPSLQLELIKSYIKDLSFENPQSITQIDNNYKIEDVNLNIDVNLTHYDNLHIEVILKIKCEAHHHDNILFHLELVYSGFFKILNNEKYDDDHVTKEAVSQLFPLARSLIDNITKNGGSIPILLDDLNLDALEKN